MTAGPAPAATPREELRAVVRGFGLVVRSSPPLTLVLLALTALQGAAPAVVVAQTGRFLSRLEEAVQAGAGSEAGADVRRALVLIGVAILAGQVLGPVQQAVLFGLQRRFEAYLARRLMAATLALPGLAWFEDADFRDQLSVTGWVKSGPVHSLHFLAQTAQRITQMVAMAAVAATYAGWVPVVLVGAAVPGGLASWRFESSIGLARWRGSSEARRADYYRDLTVLREPGKEVRVFRLGDWLLGRQAGHWEAGVRGMWDARRRSLVAALALHGVAIAALCLTYLAMLRSALDGRTDVGRFAAASAASVALLAAVVGLFRGAASARRSSYYLPAALRILDLPDGDPRLHVGGHRPARGLPSTGIVFESVTFTYPGTRRPVLRSLDLAVPAGSSVALVGENGAGKTTLVKLLCRFYDPDEGRILLDGVDLRDFDLADLRRRMAVIFQDFVRYRLPARDNVGFGAWEAAGDESLVREAARRTGLLDRVESLPEGWETPLAREFGGVDLSGGEWQRVALARAVMAQVGRQSDLLVLDEPTASLDVRLEHELYGHFAELTAGRTTLLVSHRFSTVRMAGRIVLIAGGRVVEDGSHDELITAGGRYAELYELQAAHFRRTGTLE